MNVSEMIKDKQYILDKMVKTEWNSFKEKWCSQLKAELEVLKEIETEEMKVWNETAKKDEELLVPIHMSKQEKYCKDNKLPMFVALDGHCWNCHRLLEDTDTEHITGCSYCHRSFCD